MSYALALATFLIGAMLGVSVARRRIVRDSESTQGASASPVTQKVQDAVLSSSDQTVALRTALDALPNGVILVDPQGREVFRNVSATTISGVRHIDALITDAVSALIRTASSEKHQHRRFDSAGTPSRSFDIRTQRLSQGYVVATIDDVTEQTRIDTVRTDFVANLSHELKTPIGGIAALADTMIGEHDPTVMARLAARIVDESYRLSRIVDDLLDLSRIEFGGTDDWEKVAISEVVHEVVTRMQHEATRAGVKIETSMTGDGYTLGDRMQLVSALLNLVSNAVKYSGDGKIVSISVRVDEESVCIAVTDTGIGIAAKDHQRIFERFYRVDRARSRTTGGSGLGLAIVRHVISNHDGTISVVSEEGRGSTFTVVLPRFPADGDALNGDEPNLLEMSS